MDKRLVVAFDVDGCLINERDEPNHSIVWILKWFVGLNADVIVWSGGGTGYAEMWARRLSVNQLVRIARKGGEKVDIAFDDQDVKLGKVNVNTGGQE